MNNSTFVFYGTGGSDGIPNPFCRCPVCQHARACPDADRRKRSMLRLCATHAVDMGPDAACAAADLDDFFTLRHILVTHTHEDHFYYGLVQARAFAKPLPAQPLHIYLTGPAYDILERYYGNAGVFAGRFALVAEKAQVKFHLLAYGQQTEIDGFGVLPLKGNHNGNMGEHPANYLFTLPSSKTLYYGVDTGWYLPETFHALKAHKIDYLISECTWGNEKGRGNKPGYHLDTNSCIGLFQQLWHQGTLHTGSHIYLTHIGHKQTATHQQLTEWARQTNFPCPITIAHDGLAVQAD